MRALLLLAALAACGSKHHRESIAEAASRLGPKLAQLPRVAAALAGVDRSQAYAGPALQTEHLDPHNRSHGNVVVAYATDLAALDHLENAPWILTRVASDDATFCNAAVTQHRDLSRTTASVRSAPIGDELPYPCELVDQAAYLAVIDPGPVEPPDEILKDPHIPFRDAGTILVFELATGRYLGARAYHLRPHETTGAWVKHGATDTERTAAFAHASQQDDETAMANAIDAALAGR